MYIKLEVISNINRNNIEINSIFVASKLNNQSTAANLKAINMRTNNELLGALRTMYFFLGGDGSMQSSSYSAPHHFRCGFGSENKVLIESIVKSATGQGKHVTCEYSGSIVNIEVTF